MEENNTSTTLQVTKILKYWHKIEFFESTDIKALEDDAKNVLKIEQEDLQTCSSLPWINPEQIRQVVENYSTEKKYTYELFFGIFDRAEIFARAKRAFPEHNDINNENLRDEGRTCSIKCLVDQDGIIDSESFEFSTVTWALGQLETGGLDHLQFGDYQEATNNLHKHFIKIITLFNNIKKEHELPLLLTSYEINEFLKAMAEWTSFSPEQSAPALFIKLKETRPKKKNKQLVQQDITKTSPDFTCLSHLSLPSIPEKNETLSDDNNDLSILNSFYIKDIENVLNHIKSNGLISESPLNAYLTGCRNKKPDLLLPEGRSLLLEKLRLNQLPSGRWPSDVEHNMSFMQQFAINTLEQELTVSGLYSVNGPPGTGKTTMLRDVIANNLVKRATILAGLESAADAFEGSLKEEITGKQRTIPCLSSKLCGYEMVVVSSNNTAVENISCELPQIGSLGTAWQDISYFKSVAQKLAAPTDKIEHPELNDGKTFKIKPLTDKTDCWGLVAAALGKQKNRDIFGNRIFFEKGENALTEPPANTYRTLYEEIKLLSEKTFTEAQKAFNQAQEQYTQIISELKIIEILNDQQNACQKLALNIKKLLIRQQQLRVFLRKRQIRLPTFQISQIKRICREKTIIAKLNGRLRKSQALYQLEKQRLQKTLITLNEEQKKYESLKQKYADVQFYKYETDLNTQDIQRSAFGQCQILNEARSLLTVRALELHQAWLVTAYKECRLQDALFSLMSAINGSIQNKQASQALWRLLFMIVPVISSTFASVARQFSAFNAEDIGWLFIDEAGQATPQQAVGALWRAKRAVVVGDPLQIEPVFTIPPAFVEAIAKRDFDKNWQDWSPTIQSVQSLADRVNPFGTSQISKNIWLGSPLRVHRRCDEPMFSLANAIAYNNKMLHGRDNLWPSDDFLWGKSSWFDICGEVQGKHYVPAQGQHVLSMLKEWLKNNNQSLPDAYIISPFKQVKEQLKSLLKKELHGVKNINKWVDERIGTVHTFQGKEEKNVILVLGLSETTQGATKWASSKPNLLNVAVTRAQKRIYIIGSKNIWSGCQYFDIADKKLSTVVPHNCTTVTPETVEV